MSTLTDHTHPPDHPGSPREPFDEIHDGPDTEADAKVVRRPRRRVFTARSAPVFGLLLAAAGFLVGVDVEKARTSPSSTASTVAARRSGFPTGAAATPGGFGGAGARGTTGAAGAAPAGGFPGGGGGGGGGGNSSVGEITSVSGRTLYLKETSGTTVKVTLPSVAKLSKSVMVPAGSLRPGDTVTVQGLQGSTGTIVATSVSDSGASSTTSTASSAPTGSVTGAGG
jgi:Domain of unknown function (DUF5666)